MWAKFLTLCFHLIYSISRRCQFAAAVPTGRGPQAPAQAAGPQLPALVTGELGLHDLEMWVRVAAQAIVSSQAAMAYRNINVWFTELGKASTGNLSRSNAEAMALVEHRALDLRSICMHGQSGHSQCEFLIAESADAQAIVRLLAEADLSS